MIRLQGYLSRYGAAIDVEISVQECTCRRVPWGDKYYRKSLKKKQFSYVVSRDDGIMLRESGGKYFMDEIKTPSEITRNEIDQIIKDAKSQSL